MVPNLRFNGFNINWLTSSVGQHFDICMCKRIFASQTDTYGDIPFYKIGTIGRKPDAYISRTLFNEYKLKYKFPKKGEILITCSGTIGKAFVFDGKDSYYQDSNIVWLSNRDEIIDNNFLYYFISNINWSFLNSTTIVRLYNDDLRNLKISFPFKNEQVKIANLLSLLDKRIETQNKIIKDLELQRVALINHIYNYNGGKEYKFKDLYSKAKEGGTPSTIVASYYQNGKIPFIKIDDLNNKYINHNKTYITEDGMKNSSAWLIPENSVILSNGATIGVVSINTYPVTTKQGILGIIPSNLVNYEYLYYLLNTEVFKRHLKKVTTKGTMECAYIKDIDNIILCVPSLDIQLKCIKVLSSLDTRIAIENILIEKYKSLKKFLLQNLFI